MKLKGDCNCGNRLACGCTLSFSSYLAESTSVLDVGDLVGGTCSFEEYVIDWYLNGNKELVSGTFGSASDVSAFHPFTGAAAIPVQGGTWVPVVRYVRLTGQTTKIFFDKKNCRDWCSDLTGLPTITISSLNCGLTLNPLSGYQYSLSYSTTQDFSLATRTLIWDLQSDTKYVAFKFAAAVVADKIEIFYKDNEVPVSSWIVGSNYNTDNRTVMPYRSRGDASFVLEMPIYQSGDYLTIKITPSVLESTNNTIWVLSIQCLTAYADFASECALLNEQFLEFPALETLEWIDDSAYCRVLLNIQLSSPLLNVTSFPLLYTYSALRMAKFSLLTDQLHTTGFVQLIFNRSSVGNANMCISPPSCANAAGTISVSKSSNVFTISYTSQIDYDAEKVKYDLLLVSTCFTTYSENVQIVEHYHFTTYNFRVAATCGDTGTEYNITAHILSPVTWDYANKTVTIEVLNVVNEYVSLVCDTTSSRINTYITSVNSTINNTTMDGKITMVRNRGFNGTRVNTVTTFVTQATGSIYYYLLLLSSPCFPNYMHDTSSYEKRMYSLGISAKITNDADRANNFELWGFINYETGYTTSSVLVYKIVDGVQTFPVL